jgi:hypothetical protein
MLLSVSISDTGTVRVFGESPHEAVAAGRIGGMPGPVRTDQRCWL